MQDRLRNLCLRPADACSSCDDDDVQPDAELLTVESQALSNQSSHTMPYDTVSDLLACDNTYSIFRQAVPVHIHDEIPVCAGIAGVIHRGKLPTFVQ